MKNKKFVFVFVLISFFSLINLHKDMFNVDAQYWLQRSSNFISALLDLNFRKTFQDPKPGVPVMYLSGFSLEVFLSIYEAVFSFRPEFYTHDTFVYINFFSRLPLVLLNLTFLYFSYKLVKSLLDEKIALLYLILLGLQPFYLANSRFLHVDIPLAVYMNFSFLLYLYFYLQNNKQFFLALSGVFAALALLTKTQALFLFPMLLLFNLFLLLQDPRSFKKILCNSLLWLISLIFTYLLVFPALWVDLGGTLSKIYGEAFHVASVGNTRINPFFHYFSLLIKDLSPIGLFLLLASIISLLVSSVKKSKNRILYISILSYIVFYFLQMSIIKQKIARYLLPSYPMYALGISIMLLRLSEKEKYVRYITLFFLVLQVSILVYYFPNYYAFVVKSPADNSSGALFSDVGDYINAKESPTELKVVSMTKVASLRPFIKGKTFGHEEDLPNNWTADYLVTNDYWLGFYGKPDFFDACVFEHNISFRNVSYWDIYKCK